MGRLIGSDPCGEPAWFVATCDRGEGTRTPGLRSRRRAITGVQLSTDAASDRFAAAMGRSGRRGFGLNWTEETASRAGDL